jgi:hypothetical protein
MASNEIPRVLDPLVILAEDAADGAHQHEAAIGLKQNKEADLRAALTDLMGDEAQPQVIPGQQNLWLQKKAAKTAASALKRSADSNVKAYLAGTVDWLKNHLGPVWTGAWEEVGLTGGSLALPTTPELRLAMLPTVKAYFTHHPAHQLVPPPPPAPGQPEFSAAKSQALFTAGSDARSAAAEANAEAGQAKAARDAAQHRLYERMVGLRQELGQLLGDDDPRWYAFGFNRPDDPETPQVPEGLVVTPGAAGTHTLLVDWGDARRATGYKVYVQGPGDPLPVLKVTVEDSDATVGGLTAGQVVTITVRARNAAGESQPSAPVTVTVP